jgi:hypothetical protein
MMIMRMLRRRKAKGSLCSCAKNVPRKEEEFIQWSTNALLPSFPDRSSTSSLSKAPHKKYVVDSFSSRRAGAMVTVIGVSVQERGV